MNRKHEHVVVTSEHSSRESRPAAKARGALTRRSFLTLAGTGAALALLGCEKDDATSSSDAAASPDASSSTDLSGTKLTFVGDDAFAPYRLVQVTDDGGQKVVGLDIAVADEMARRLGFTYDFEPQDFSATLASLQGSDASFTMAMSSNPEREQTYDFTRGYYQPLVGVLTLGDKIESVDALADLSISCTTGTVQNKFVTAVAPNADVHTYDGGDQCLQEVLAGRVQAYVCDGAEGLAMQGANPDTVIGFLPREQTSDYVGVYRIMAKKGAPFVSAFDACVGEMLDDGTLDALIAQWVGEDFVWGGSTADAGTSTVSAS
jgi:polar amino acid transport system substrate-binding protein